MPYRSRSRIGFSASLFFYMMMEILSTLILSYLEGLTHAQALTLIQHYGTAEAALADDASESALWAEIKKNTMALRKARESALREMDYCDRHDIRIIPYTHSEYPRRLKESEVNDAPLQLFYKGTGTLNRRHTLSVVGTRHITAYGKQVCERLFQDLANQLPDLLVVSGLAYGVDIHAHRAALSGGLDTIAVLAHGLQMVYPRMHEHTAEEMMLHGGLLTEYPSGVEPDRYKFVRRNRIVAGMSSATLVVESAQSGGALITAEYAWNFNRDVMAIPGRITDEFSAGCNKLIRQHKAEPVSTADDILKLLNWTADYRPAYTEPQLFVVYTPEQQKIMDALHEADELSVDQLSLRTGLSVSRVNDLLFDLEDMKEVKRVPGNRYRLYG